MAMEGLLFAIKNIAIVQWIGASQPIFDYRAIGAWFDITIKCFKRSINGFPADSLILFKSLAVFLFVHYLFPCR